MPVPRLLRLFTPLATACLSASVGVVSIAAAQTPDSATSTIQIGDPFPRWELTDQHDQTHRLPGDTTQAIVFSSSKQADETLSPVLESVVGDRLISGEVIYLSDISRMPGLISRLFALPSLRDRDYPVVLIREEGVSAPLVTETDCLALYRLGQGTVVAREDLCVESDVTNAF
ncbi:hypothetical protein SR882_07195 [Guyparkeria halophila]|uniref:Uncharacterized protein n=1 Tax=Guyparkeria halophila TaxID=47960 RepID=A0ABZ0YTQ5_9GAMM|nr:hypothetical protein [Guyparkeria halophila]WQH15550.1 hypothetical protein SR882_07195 [Guyparkeria halophila]